MVPNSQAADRDWLFILTDNNNNNKSEEDIKSLCCNCGIAKDRISIDESGVCATCSYDLDQKLTDDLIRRLTVPPLTSRASGVYLIEFVSHKECIVMGTKLGKAKILKSRTNSYQLPWCYAIGRTFAVRLPLDLIGTVEKLLMKSIKRTTGDSEFFGDNNSFSTLVTRLDGIIYIYRHRLTAWLKNQE